MSDAIIATMLRDGRLCVDMDTGEVFSPRSNTPNKPIGALTKKGYLRTCLHVDGKSVFVMIHRVVCIATHGLHPDAGIQVNHINGRKADNAPSNLEWASHQENMAHASRTGTHRGVGRRDGVRDKFGRFGAKAAGRLLDGVEHNAFPEVR